MREALKKERAKQVQFCMPVELRLKLRKVLSNSGISMADLFNDTAKEYLKTQQIDKVTEDKNDG